MGGVTLIPSPLSARATSWQVEAVLSLPCSSAFCKRSVLLGAHLARWHLLPGAKPTTSSRT